MRDVNLPREVICVTPFGLEAQNSASDLAKQMCAGHDITVDVSTRRKGRASGVSLLGAITNPRIFHGSTRSSVIIYYQLSDPFSIILVFILRILTGSRLVVHVLDNFIESIKYRKFFGIPRRLAILMMRSADQLLSISPAMQEEFSSKYGLVSRTAFRWRPVKARNTARGGNGKILFGGAVNDKTNLAALIEFAHFLKQRANGTHLDVYVRGGNSKLEMLPNVTLKPAIDESSFVEIAADYEAFLVPFNRDGDSLSFYRESCPSKASALFAAQIPILVFGPEEFWFFKFLTSYDFSTSSLDRLPDCRKVPSDEYVQANEALGLLCEVHSLVML